MGIRIANNVASVLTNSLIPATITLQVTPGTGSSFPTLGVGDYFYATLISPGGAIEIVKITARSGDTLTATRGQDNTVPLPFPIGTKIEMRVNAGLFNDVAALATNSLQTNTGGTVSGNLAFSNNGFTPFTISTSSTTAYAASTVYLNTSGSTGNQATALTHVIENGGDSSETAFQIQSRTNGFGYGATWYVINYKNNYQSFLVGSQEVLRLNASGANITGNARIQNGGFLALTTTGTTALGYVGSDLSIVGSGNATDLSIYNAQNGAVMLYTNSSERMRVTSTGRAGFGTTTPSCALDVTGGIRTSRTNVTAPAATDGNIYSGTYTPTQVGGATNVSSVTFFECHYMRVGNVVTVGGQISITATVAATDTNVALTLPIASAMTSAGQCAGTGAVTINPYAGGNFFSMVGNTATGAVEIRARPTVNTSLSYNFTFTYLVI